MALTATHRAIVPGVPDAYTSPQTNLRGGPDMRRSIADGNFIADFAMPRPRHLLPPGANPVTCPMVFLRGIPLSGEM